MKPFSTLILIAAVSLLAGCFGDAGNQENEDSKPFAIVAVLNHAFAEDGNGNVTTTVRAGTEVFLTGKDSDSTVSPVLNFAWQQLDVTPANRVSLVTRNASTVSFTAPATAQNLHLRFALTVTDAKRRTASKEVAVTIVGIPDTDHFLSYQTATPTGIRLFAAASRDLTPEEMQASGDVQFRITTRKLVDYTVPESVGPWLEVGQQVIEGQWLASDGIKRECGAIENPMFRISQPYVNLKEIIAASDVRDPAQRPNPALVDRFELKLEIQIDITGGTLPAGVTPIVCADRPPLGTMAQFAQSQAGTGALSIGLDDLIGLPNLQDTRSSTRAYYKTIDPNDQRTNFLDWLKLNGFVPADRTTTVLSEIGAGADVNATYANNFDLGFGRDMYARIVKCDPGVTAPVLGSPIDDAVVGKCDIAAVVINYISLESAAKKLSPVVAVAMEYSKPAGSERRIVQFYTFAPNLVTGSYERVSSADLDGRGERYMPGGCTACHGGQSAGVATTGPNAGEYLAGGNVNASFLPWDLDAFLFSDQQGAAADRSYTDQATRPLFTRASQEEPLRRLNQIAYLTYSDPERPNRFTLQRQLVRGWYDAPGNSNPNLAFTSTAFQGQFVPPGWTANGVDGAAGTADDNPADTAALYIDVFARYCRSCHTAQVPGNDIGGAQLELLAGNQNCQRLTNHGALGLGNQVPMACYAHFFDQPNLPQRLASGSMPFARLTMDRLWVSDLGAGVSAADALYAHLAREYMGVGAVATDRLAALLRPGNGRASITIVPDVADTDSLVRLDGRSSEFAAAFAWSLERCESNQAAVCRSAGAGAPPAPSTLTCTAENERLANATTSVANFTVPGPAVYRATLAINGGANTATQALNVTDFTPCAANDTDGDGNGDSVSVLGEQLFGATVPINVPPLFAAGNGTLAKHRVIASAFSSNRISVTPAACATAPGCLVAEGISLAIAASGPSATSEQGSLTLTLVDPDGDARSTEARITGVSAFVARDISLSTDANVPLPVNLFTQNPSGTSVTSITGTLLDGASMSELRDGQNRLIGFIYTPPANFSTHAKLGNSPRSGFTEQVITYRMQGGAGAAAAEDEATIRIPIRALASFTDAVATWRDPNICATCHQITPTRPAVAGPTYLSSGIFSDLSSGNLTTAGVTNLAKVNQAPFAIPPVDASHPTDPQILGIGGLICYPLQLCGSHSGGMFTRADLKAVIDWIASGANNDP